LRREVEYKALVNGATEVTLFNLYSMNFIFPEPVSFIWCDNLTAIYLTDNLVFLVRTKHIYVDFHFVQGKVVLTALSVRFVSCGDQVVGGSTEPVTKQMLTWLCRNLNLVPTCLD
jgi:hypothetical protein